MAKHELVTPETYGTPTLTEIKKASKPLFEYVPNGKDYWETDGITVYKGKHASFYSHRLENALEKWKFRSFFDIAKKRKKRSKQNRILDLFGSGYDFLFPDLVDALVGVRSKNVDDVVEDSITRTKDLSKKYRAQLLAALQGFRDLEAQNKRVIVPANLYVGETWNSTLPAAMETVQAEEFDIITCMPTGAFYWNKINPNRLGKWHKDKEHQYEAAFLVIYLTLLDRAYQLCTEDEGYIFTQIPEYNDTQQTYIDTVRLTKILNQYEGIQAYCVPEKGSYVKSWRNDPVLDKARPILTIKKTSGAPKTLAEVLKNR